MNINSLKYPVCIAHRGVKELYPENTIVSFQAALDSETQMIELDVALSSDRQLMVIHDETLDRTTNGTGKVSLKSLTELKQLDAGSWFDRRFKDERIPTLNEVIDLVGTSAVLNIEIKKEYFEEGNPGDAIESQVLQVVEKNNLLNSIIVSSFEIRYLQRLRKLSSTVPLAFISLEPADQLTIDACKQMNLFSWNGWHETLTQDQVDSIHRANLKVFSFTIQKQEEFDKVMRFGVDGIFADNHPHFKSKMWK